MKQVIDIEQDKTTEICGVKITPQHFYKGHNLENWVRLEVEMPDAAPVVVSGAAK